MASPQDLVVALSKIARGVLRTVHLMLGFGVTEGVEHFAYNITVTTGAADAIGTTYAKAIRISQESVFVLTEIVCNARVVGTGALVGMSTNAAAAGDLPDFPYKMQITDGGSDRILHQEQIDATLLYSTFGGLRRGAGVKPKLFRPNSNVQIDLTSLKQPAAAWLLTVAFVGFKVYKAQPSDIQLPLFQ